MLDNVLLHGKEQMPRFNPLMVGLHKRQDFITLNSLCRVKGLKLLEEINLINSPCMNALCISIIIW